MEGHPHSAFMTAEQVGSCTMLTCSGPERPLDQRESKPSAWVASMASVSGPPAAWRGRFHPEVYAPATGPILSAAGS